jgi:hypothetical protein
MVSANGRSLEPLPPARTSTPYGASVPPSDSSYRPSRGPSPTHTTASGSASSIAVTAVVHAVRRSSSSGAARPATSGTSSGGCGQTAAATNTS